MLNIIIFGYAVFYVVYSSGQNKVPTAELKSHLIVVQKSFDSRSIVAQWKIVSAYAPL